MIWENKRAGKGEGSGILENKELKKRREAGYGRIKSRAGKRRGKLDMGE